MELTSLNQTKDVEFQDVCYTVKQRKNFVKVIGERQILKGVSGSFRNGQLSAIMGPSGAGKSSLLNAISGYVTSGVEGLISIDRKHSCYITQEDHHQTLLSVEELMNLACDLKLKRNHQQKKSELISDILESLNLNHRRNVNANDLSGGERKRLSVALELVANPKIFFLDEPTSGLDEVTAAQCIRLLRSLAQRGHTVVCTIHQPSATIFNYFDNVYVLAKGKCVYQGSPKALVSYLSHAEKECPRHYSPADYIIELCDFEDPQMISTLSALVDNGKLRYTAECDQEYSSFSMKYDQHTSHSFMPFRQALFSLFPESPPSKSFSSIFNSKTKSDGSTLLNNGKIVLLDQAKTLLRQLSTDRQETDGHISGFQQFSVLLHILFLRILRARIPIIIQILHHLMVGLLFVSGVLYFKRGNQGSEFFGHLKYCISVIVMITYTQTIIPVISYPLEVKIVKKQTFNHWYSLSTYFMALCMSRMPLQLFYNIIFLTLSYWMTGFPFQWWRFAIFVAVGIMVSLVAEGLGLTIGAALSITNGSVFGPMSIAGFMGLAIYGFDFAGQISPAMDWFMKISFMRDGVVALVITIFGYGRDILDCDEIYCHFSNPRVLLKFLNLENVSVLHQILYLFVLFVVFRISLFISLWRRCKT
ncbi:ATP-binding cassette sub-family G member 1 [Musca vetustissima]|uniref:ATP-binding cassette sub-family G member 1 n=1 Tax=Musca vetustissima TaxID=27455 RepID=UPI002AB683AB|nr:ATP-binding cassette sub-family G member 1 [Musca vetustissima]